MIYDIYIYDIYIWYPQKVYNVSEYTLVYGTLKVYV